MLLMSGPEPPAEALPEDNKAHVHRFQMNVNYMFVAVYFPPEVSNKYKHKLPQCVVCSLIDTTHSQNNSAQYGHKNRSLQLLS